MIARHETAATILLAALIRAYPVRAAAALTAAGVPVSSIDPVSVGVEQSDGDHGRTDITATTDRGTLIVEAKLSAYPDLRQIEKYLSGAADAFAVQLVPDLNIAEARAAIGQHDRITVIGWGQLLEGFDCDPIAEGLAADIIAVVSDPKTHSTKRAQMQAVVDAAALDSAVTARVQATAVGYPTVDLTHADTEHVYGQVEPDRGGGGTYTGTVGVLYNDEDLDDPTVFADFRDALLQAEQKLDAAGIRYRRNLQRSPIHTRLDMADKPYLARGYSSGNCLYYLGVKVPGDTVEDVLTETARALAVYAQICEKLWPATVLAMEN